tara:strand:+ start:904 stop:1428 length:525 start_codon:yes stop_codon:yes gene_type:complete
MKRFILVFFISFCTIGGEEAEMVATIENTVELEEQEEEVTFEEGLLSFARCMREEGLDFPDPSFDSEGNPEFTDFDIEDQDVFEAAFVNCEDILRDAFPNEFDLDPEVQAALYDASLEFAQCMREEGLDFPDPKPGEFGFFAFRDAEVDFNDPAFQNAFEICQPENPLEGVGDE